MVQSKGKTSLTSHYGTTDNTSAGLRPSMEKLVAQVDQSDPAFMFIAAEQHRIKRTGGVLDETTIEQAVARGRDRHAQHTQEEQDSRPERIPPSIVYYVRRGNAIKIGTTTSPHKRFAQLLPDEILAWEPGGRTEEVARHGQFRDLRINGSAEYFRLGDALVNHIKEVRSANGAPDPAWPTFGRLGQRRSRAKLPDLPITPGLVTLDEGTRQLGIRLGTARVWIHRGKLRPVLRGADGVDLYFLSDLRSLAAKGRKAA